MLKRSKSSKSVIATLAMSAIIAASVFVIAPVNVRAADPDDSALLIALGYTIGQSLMVTHLAVGTLADAYASKTYKVEEANSILDTHIRLANGLKQQMLKLLAPGTLRRDDAKFMQQAIEVLDLVLKESQDLKTYMASETRGNAEAYENSRNKALKEIKILLDIKN